MNASESVSDEERPLGTGGVDRALPFFAYGALQRDEIGFWKLSQSVDPANIEQVEVAGTLVLRDGRPLLELGNGSVHGDLMRFRDPDKGYDAIGAYEPAGQYHWADPVRLADGGSANIVIGRKTTLGVFRPDRDEPAATRWRSSDDPLLRWGIPAVASLTEYGDRHALGADSPAAWVSLFRNEAALLLMWSLIERYATLRFGAGSPEGRIGSARGMRGDPGTVEIFRTALKRARGSRSELPEIIYDSRDPDRKARVDDAIRYLRLVRNNLVHRGKAAWRDAGAVDASLEALMHAVPTLFDRDIPGWRLE